jgi:hypothetical protein
VESLSTDVRVSQYADINYAAKKFTSDKWYWLNPTGISGYLVFLPNTPVVWIDEQFKKSYKIPMRVSKDIYEKNTILIASLNVSESLMRVEDLWIYAGKNIRATPFTQRWNSLLDFYTLYYKPDLVLQQGICIETAIYESLSSIRNWETVPRMMLAQGNLFQRRLRVQFIEKSDTFAPNQKKLESPVYVKKPAFVAESDGVTASVYVKKPAFVAESDDSAAQAFPHPEYPDTYDIWINGVKKGYAAVQDINLSRRLKKASEGLSESKGLRVKVEWNSEFSAYEINELIDPNFNLNSYK